MKFYKYHGLGNDYIVINPADFTGELSESAIRTICHRNFGIGSDGILLGPLPSDEADFAGTHIRVHTTTFPVHYYDGSLVVDLEGETNSAEVFTHTGIFSSTTLYYSFFSYDQAGHFSDPVYISVTLGTTQTASFNLSGSQMTYPDPVRYLYQGTNRGLYRQEIKGTQKVFLPIIVSKQ